MTIVHDYYALPKARMTIVHDYYALPRARMK